MPGSLCCVLACVDVDYPDSKAVAACLLFSDWTAEEPDQQIVEVIEDVEPYIPGQFYRRELPCLLKVLGRCPEAPEVVIVDGYVWLGDEGKPGLGGHLYEALGRATPVVGVAKSRFRGAGPLQEVFRGRSNRPLLVSAVGMPLEEAASRVLEMHGQHRLPTILVKTDGLSRRAELA